MQRTESSRQRTKAAWDISVTSEQDVNAQDEMQQAQAEDTQTDTAADNGSQVTDSQEEDTAGKDASAVISEDTDEQTEDSDEKEEEAATKTEYTYEDGNISVTAILDDASAIPDDADFEVTQVTENSSDYNYDAYMEALNSTASEENTYDSSNTLLYDIRFMAPEKDADGNETGNMVELQPEEGAVSVTITFRNNQLSEGIEAQSADDVEIEHLALDEAALEANANITAGAAITSSDVSVENVANASASVEGAEEVSFTTDSFSLFAVSVSESGSASDITCSPIGDQLTIDSVLGNAKYFGIVADTWYQAEAETNAAVKTLATNNSQSGNDLTDGDNAQPWYIGELTAQEGGTPSFRIKGDAGDVYTPASYFNYFTISNTIRFHDTPQETVDAYVEAMMSDIAAKSSSYASQNSVTSNGGKLPEIDTTSRNQKRLNSNYVIDLTGNEKGTYYLDLTDLVSSLQNGGLKLNINSNQTVVFNVTGSGPYDLQKFMITIDGNTIGSDSTNASGETAAQHVIWNFPNASKVDLKGSIVGMLLVPHGEVDITSTSAGWVCAKTVRSGSGEWHNIWQHYDQNYEKASFAIHAYKTLENATLKAGEFSFELLDENGKVLQTVTNDADGNVNFADIIYPSTGTYNYTIREVIPDDAKNANGETYKEASDKTASFTKDGIIYDGTTHKVKVEVTNPITTASYNALTATVTYDEDSKEAPTFANSSNGNKDTETSLTLTGKKYLEGRKLTDEDVFAFAVYETDENYSESAEGAKAVSTGSNDAAGTITFDPISYKKAGDYYYIVKETSEDSGSITTDKTWKKVHVVVEEQTDKSLKASVAKDSDEISFTNTYQKYDASGSTTLTGTKYIEGRNFKAGDKWTFKVTSDDDNAPLPENSQVSIEPESGTEAVLDFGTINYKLSDLGGASEKTFTYTVTESGKIPGVENSSPQTFTVKVSDNGDGTLKVENSTKKESTPLTFTNTYTASGKTTVKGIKNLEGRSFTSGDAWTFTVACEDEDAPLPEHSTVTINPTSGKQKELDFGDINYDLSCLNGVSSRTFTYTVTETGEAAGVTNSGSQTFTVTVTDQGDGTLKVENSAEKTPVTFTNTYSADGSIQLKVTKNLTGRQFMAGDEFTFTLTGDDDAPMPEEGGETVTTSATEGNSQTLSFGEIKYTAEDAGKNYTYHITESGTEDGVVNDADPVRDVTVSVTDDGSGKLQVQASYGEESNVFTNRYSASGDAVISGKKTLENAALEKGEFRFILTDEDGNELQTVTNEEDGSFAFDPIEYTLDAESGNVLGDHTYTIKEAKGDSTQIAYDDTVYTVNVNVSDNGDGTLNTEVSYKDADGRKAEEAAFTNTAQTAAVIRGSKTLDGAELTAGEFRFNLLDSNGDVIDTAKNDADGNFSFARITYTKEGTYSYTVEEQHSGETIDGIRYSGESIPVQVVVTKDENGVLTASADQTASFTNTRMRTLTVNKVWEDENDAAGYRPSRITVNLLKDGVKVQSAVLSEENSWTYTFENLDPDAEYTVSENLDERSGYTAAVSYDGDTATLTNTFVGRTTIRAYKVLNGAALTDGAYTFKLEYNSEKEDPVYAVNDADGNIVFGNIKYDAAGYTVTEVAGDDVHTEYDTGSIVYDADGNMVTSSTVSEDTTFTNTYKPTILRVRKQSKDAPYDGLEGSVYGLYLVNDNGGNDVLVESETSDSEGYMYFSSIEYGKTYYLKEIEAPEGHEVDPYAGPKFQIRRDENGNLITCDEDGNEISIRSITSSEEANEQDSTKSYIQYRTEASDLSAVKAGKNKTLYANSLKNGIDAAAVADKSAFPDGTVMEVAESELSEKALESLENQLGKVNVIACYDVTFRDEEGNEVEPESGSVEVTIQNTNPESLGDAASDNLKIVHLMDKNGKYLELSKGSIASSGGQLLETSFTSDSFSSFAVVEPQDNTKFGSNYLLADAGVADEVSELNIAKLDSEGNYLAGADLQIIEKATGKVVAEWTSTSQVQTFNRWFVENVEAMNVETDYVLHEVSAPEGYSVADDIMFRINQYDSSLTIYRYDENGNLVEDSETDTFTIEMVDSRADVTTKNEQKTITKDKHVQKQGEDSVVTVQGTKAVKTGDLMHIGFLVILAAAAAAVIALVCVRRKSKTE